MTGVKSSFSQTVNIGNIADIDIRGFTTQKEKFQWQNVNPGEDWNPGSLIPSPTLSFKS